MNSVAGRGSLVTHGPCAFGQLGPRRDDVLRGRERRGHGRQAELGRGPRKVASPLHFSPASEQGWLTAVLLRLAQEARLRAIWARWTVSSTFGFGQMVLVILTVVTIQLSRGGQNRLGQPALG